MRRAAFVRPGPFACQFAPILFASLLSFLLASRIASAQTPTAQGATEDVARTILGVAAELRGSRIAVIPAGEPLHSDGAMACTGPWGFAFALERDLVRLSGSPQPLRSWESWVVSGAGFTNADDADDGAFREAVRQSFQADRTVVITPHPEPWVARIGVETFDREGNSLREFEVVLRIPFPPESMPRDDDRCSRGVESASSAALTAGEVGDFFLSVLLRDEVRALPMPGLALWVDPGILLRGEGGCDRSQLLHERLTRVLVRLGGAARPVSEVRSAAALQPGSPGVGVLNGLGNTTAVLTVRRSLPEEGGQTDIELIVGGRTAQTWHRPIRVQEWVTLEDALRCTSTASEATPRRTVPVHADPMLMGVGLEAQRRRRAWSVAVQGHLSGALVSADGSDGKGAGGGSIRFDVAPSARNSSWLLGGSVAFSTDGIGSAQALFSYGITSAFRVGVGAGGAVSFRSDPSALDAFAGASALVLAPFGRGYGGTLGAEIYKGFTTPLVYVAFSLGLWFGAQN